MEKQCIKIILSYSQNWKSQHYNIQLNIEHINRLRKKLPQHFWKYRKKIVQQNVKSISMFEKSQKTKNSGKKKVKWFPHSLCSNDKNNIVLETPVKIEQQNHKSKKHRDHLREVRKTVKARGLDTFYNMLSPLFKSWKIRVSNIRECLPYMTCSYIHEIWIILSNKTLRITTSVDIQHVCWSYRHMALLKGDPLILRN